MKHGQFLSFSLMIFLHGCTSYSVEESSVIADVSNRTIKLTVPASLVALELPQHGMTAQEHNAKSYRYFLFHNIESDFSLSGWFEPESQYPGFETSWRSFLAKWQGKVPENIEFDKVNQWDVVRYEVPLGNCRQPNLKAHMVNSGTWIELHLSSKCEQAVSYQLLNDYLKQVVVKSKAISDLQAIAMGASASSNK